MNVREQTKGISSVRVRACVYVLCADISSDDYTSTENGPLGGVSGPKRPLLERNLGEMQTDHKRPRGLFFFKQFF